MRQCTSVSYRLVASLYVFILIINVTMVSYDVAFKMFIEEAIINQIYKQSLIKLVKLFCIHYNI